MTEKAKHPILVVDDEPEILYSLRALLRRDFILHTAQSSYEAIHLLEREPIHVVMTDQRMPGMTGVEFLARVRHEHPQAIRLIFTGYADIKAVIDAINRGSVYRYLTKPWDPDELLAVLHKACEAYDEIAERKQRLKDVRAYLTESQEMLRSLCDGCGGTVNPPEQPRVEQLIETGKGLREKVDRVLASDEQKGSR